MQLKRLHYVHIPYTYTINSNTIYTYTLSQPPKPNLTPLTYIYNRHIYNYPIHTVTFMLYIYHIVYTITITLYFNQINKHIKQLIYIPAYLHYTFMASLSVPL